MSRRGSALRMIRTGLGITRTSPQRLPTPLTPTPYLYPPPGPPMTDETRQLITDMAMHLAHMQELLEDYEYGDPEDYHWYRESVRLRSLAAEVQL